MSKNDSKNKCTFICIFEIAFSNELYLICFRIYKVHCAVSKVHVTKWAKIRDDIVTDIKNSYKKC